MAHSEDYRASHTAKEKGKQYDGRFKRFAWRKYLWGREKLALETILQNYFADRQVRYLDFACGTGRILQFMHTKVNNATGVDISESMLNECRAKLSHTEIIQGDITRDDILCNREFDLITSFRFFPNAQPQLRREVIEKISKHLAPGGMFVFNNHRNRSSILFTIGRMFKKDLKCMSNEEIDSLVKDTDLKIEKVVSLGVLPGYDNHPMILPSFIHKFADRFIERFNISRALCQDNIFICCKEVHNRRHADSASVYQETVAAV